MMVTVLFSPAAACLGADFAACSVWPEAAAAAFSSAAGRLAQGDMRDRLAAKGIVGEQGDGGKADQEQAEQHGQRLHRGERQPEPALLALGFLSERCAQLVGRFRHEPPRINRDEDTTMGRIRAPATRAKAAIRDAAEAASGKRDWFAGASKRIWNRQQKGRPEGRPFHRIRAWFDQFAALVAGLSIAALSPVAGAVVAVDLMPCSRSAAVFSALSSLASGGT